MQRLGEITAVLNARNLRTGLIGRAVWVMTAAMFVASSRAALALGVWLFQRGEASLGAVCLVQYAAMTREPFHLVGSQLQEVARRFQPAASRTCWLCNRRWRTERWPTGPAARRR